MSVMANLIGYSTTLMSIVGYEDRTRELIKDMVTVDIVPDAVKKLPYVDDSFDCVASCGVLEHVRETGGSESVSLTELARVSNKYIIIYHFPNQYSYIELLSRVLRKTYTHPYRYTYSNIVSLASGIGEDWKIAEHGRYGVLPRRVGKNITSKLTGVLLHKLDSVLNLTPLRFVSQCHYFVLEKC